jgi:uncharacterized membrane protein YfcA
MKLGWTRAPAFDHAAPVSLLDILLASLFMGLGAAVQGSVGFGANVLAAPLLVLVDADFVPVPIIVAACVLNVLVIGREVHAHDRRIRLAILGLIPGTLLATAVVAMLPERGLSLAIGAIVLVAVVLIAAGVDLRPTTPAVVGAGAASGFMNTIAGIGGPPVALLYQRATAPLLRATLSRFFLASGLISLVALVAVGEVGGEEVARTAALLPGMVVGFAVSGVVAGHVDRRTVRPAVLALSAVAAVAVIISSLS